MTHEGCPLYTTRYIDDGYAVQGPLVCILATGEVLVDADKNSRTWVNTDGVPITDQRSLRLNDLSAGKDALELVESPYIERGIVSLIDDGQPANIKLN